MEYEDVRAADVTTRAGGCSPLRPRRLVPAPVPLDKRAMSTSYYFERAAAMRAEAAREPLLQRRRLHEASAERWEEMGRQAEETERQTVINAEERRLRPYHQTLRERSAAG